MVKMEWTHMVVRIISGNVVSRHVSYRGALRRFMSWDLPGEDPIEIRKYCPTYWAKMGPIRNPEQFWKKVKAQRAEWGIG